MNAPWSPARAGLREPFTAFVCDDATVEALRPIVGELGWSAEKVNKGGLRNAVQALSVSASPSILFVDLSESGDPLNDINALAEVCEPGTVVIAAGQINDVRLYRDLIASGLHDYLLKPLSPDAMRDCFASAQAVFSAPKHVDASLERAHVMAAVIGARGGAGASTIATSVAWLMGQTHGRASALLDLDVHFGTGALQLDLEPGRGLTDAIENPSRIDGLFIERAMVKANDKLSVLSAEAPINQPLLTDGSAFYQLQEELRAAFETTIVDLPRAMLVAHPHLMQDVSVTVVVCELTLASARDVIRILAWLKSNAPQTQVLLVANRVAPTGGEVSRKEFETSVERKVDLVIPFDPKVAVQAAKLGKTVAEAGKGSKMAAAIVDLANRLINTAEDAEPEDNGKAKKKPSLVGKLGGLSAMLNTKKKAA
jgi:pilus assembly protein CpaE